MRVSGYHFSVARDHLSGTDENCIALGDTIDLDIFAGFPFHDMDKGRSCVLKRAQSIGCPAFGNFLQRLPS